MVTLMVRMMLMSFILTSLRCSGMHCIMCYTFCNDLLYVASQVTYPGVIMVVGGAQMTDSFTLSTIDRVTTPRYYKWYHVMSFDPCHSAGSSSQ